MYGEAANMNQNLNYHLIKALDHKIEDHLIQPLDHTIEGQGLKDNIYQPLRQARICLLKTSSHSQQDSKCPIWGRTSVPVFWSFSRVYTQTYWSYNLVASYTACPHLCLREYLLKDLNAASALCYLKSLFRLKYLCTIDNTPLWVWDFDTSFGAKSWILLVYSRVLHLITYQCLIGLSKY